MTQSTATERRPQIVALRISETQGPVLLVRSARKQARGTSAHAAAADLADHCHETVTRLQPKRSAVRPEV